MKIGRGRLKLTDLKQNVCGYCRLSCHKAVEIRKLNTDDELRCKARYGQKIYIYVYIK